ncbi:transcriptional repressor IclR [bacterium YEK0313]|nr:transcriptional repressor IclR [bacterium YEK0313]
MSVPKAPDRTSSADAAPRREGLPALDRALSLLAAFTVDRPTPSLTELAAENRVYRATVQRVMASFEQAGLVRRLDGGRYALGSEIARLNHVRTSGSALEALVMPVLRALADAARESATFYIRQGNKRLCLCRVGLPGEETDQFAAGALRPLDRGSSGRVLLAFSGEPGPLYDQIRRERIVGLAGDRVADVAGIAAPVFGVAGELVGAVALTMPRDRLQAADPRLVADAASRLTTLLGRG